MNKKTHITAVSLSKETEDQLSKLQQKLGRNRSQLIRDLINSSSKRDVGVKKEVPSSGFIQTDFSDPNLILRRYYELISQVSKKTSLVLGIGIINKKNKVLIGLRKNADPHVKNLSWTFPSGRFNSLNFESELVRNIARETGLQTQVLQMVHARIIPDSPKKPLRIIGLYYHCKIISGKLKPGGDFKELKWIDGTDASRHFTTSISDDITNFLGHL
jgi:ADP-ribose pyrophosphatase YjhB (NUDIX family)